MATLWMTVAVTAVSASDSDPPAPAAAPLYQLPHFDAVPGDFYPDSAARRLLQGSVGIEFQIDAEGHVQNLQQTYANYPDFSEKAQEYLKKGRFQTVAGWEQAGGPELKFVVEIQFSVVREGSTCEKKPPRVADTEVLAVCRWLVSRRNSRRLN
jgi:TonB family protein